MTRVGFGYGSGRPYITSASGVPSGASAGALFSQENP